MMQPPTSADTPHRATPDLSSTTIESMHDVFSDPYRRGVLYYLTEVEEPAALDDVLASLSDWSPQPSRPSEPGTGARSWLLNQHVLAMETFGLLEVDGEAERVELSDDVSVSVTQPWSDD